ncbi:uncharacterized protein LOC113306889 [Papaver somniferum]|uniref:uncharacterized protein LOC113306889 n=1 Tax=Papaver somniferum TaxID=3469 RepID=UPI000E6FA41A|nr:uncharacterized protein LOC113306889 [Papaver somniferum]
METLEEEIKIQHFTEWLQANKVELRGCKIKYCGPNKGFGLFSSSQNSASPILLVVPLDLSITPMSVLQDPSLGLKCRAMFEQGEVDDRFLMILFLTVERLRKNSLWKPYIDMLPVTFGNPLWFNEDEILELKGTTLYKATQMQKKKLEGLCEEKVKDLVMEILDGEAESEVRYEDFLWANSIFWTRALNIPFPHSYVFPKTSEEENCSVPLDAEGGIITSEVSPPSVDENGSHGCELASGVGANAVNSAQGESVWVEGLIPGIDFCNHVIKSTTTWEVDSLGLTTGVPASMYLLSAEQGTIRNEEEICISYGDKGNEELLYLYGFVIDDNPDDYLMVHYPVEAIQSVPFADSKAQLLEVQKGEMRCLLPRNLLERGFFSDSSPQNEDSVQRGHDRMCSFSWSGQRKIPSYLNKLVFPEEFLTSLRTIAMNEEELLKVSSLLEELVGNEEEKQPSDTEVKAAIWEVCGDSGALQLLVDLLQTKMMELEDGSGSEASDTELLENARVIEIPEGSMRHDAGNVTSAEKLISRNSWCSIIYRRGQKQLTRLFLKEAEHALHLCLSEQN